MRQLKSKNDLWRQSTKAFYIRDDDHLPFLRVPRAPHGVIRSNCLSPRIAFLEKSSRPVSITDMPRKIPLLGSAYHSSDPALVVLSRRVCGSGGVRSDDCGYTSRWRASGIYDNRHRKVNRHVRALIFKVRLNREGGEFQPTPAARYEIS